MSKVDSNFHIDEEAEFRFTLSLQSNSVNAHSMMDSGTNKDPIGERLDELNRRIKELLIPMMKEWKEKHK